MPNIVFPAPGCANAQKFVDPFMGFDILSSSGATFTNLLKDSVNLTTINWSRGSSAGATFANINVVSNYIFDSDPIPYTGLYVLSDGYATNLIVSNTSSAYIGQLLSVNSNTTYTASFYAKRGTATELTYGVYDYTRSTNIVAPTSYYSQTTSTYSRISLTFTTSSSTSQIVFYPFWTISTGTVGSVYLSAPQLQVGSTATSYDATKNISFAALGVASIVGKTYGVTKLSTYTDSLKDFEPIGVLGQSRVRWNTVNDYIYDRNILDYSAASGNNILYFSGNLASKYYNIGDSVTVSGTKPTYRQTFTVTSFTTSSITINTTATVPRNGALIVNPTPAVYPISIEYRNLPSYIRGVTTSTTVRQNLLLGELNLGVRDVVTYSLDRSFSNFNIQITGKVKAIINPKGIRLENNLSRPAKFRSITRPTGIFLENNLKTSSKVNKFKISDQKVQMFSLTSIQGNLKKQIQIIKGLAQESNLRSTPLVRKLKTPLTNNQSFSLPTAIGKVRAPIKIKGDTAKRVVGKVKASIKIKEPKVNLPANKIVSLTTGTGYLSNLYILTWPSGIFRFSPQYLSGLNYIIAPWAAADGSGIASPYQSYVQGTPEGDVTIFYDPLNVSYKLNTFDNLGVYVGPSVLITGADNIKTFDTVNDYIYDSPANPASYIFQYPGYVYFNPMPTNGNLNRIQFPVGSYVRVYNSSTGYEQISQVYESYPNYIYTPLDITFPNNYVGGTYIQDASPAYYPASALSTLTNWINPIDAVLTPRENLFYSQFKPQPKGRAISYFIGRDIALTEPQLKSNNRLETFYDPTKLRGDFYLPVVGQNPSIRYNIVTTYIYDNEILIASTSTSTVKTLYFAQQDAVPYPKGSVVRIKNYGPAVVNYDSTFTVLIGNSADITILDNGTFTPSDFYTIERIDSSVYPRLSVRTNIDPTNARENLFYFEMVPNYRSGVRITTNGVDSRLLTGKLRNVTPLKDTRTRVVSGKVKTINKIIDVKARPLTSVVNTFTSQSSVVVTTRPVTPRERLYYFNLAPGYRNNSSLSYGRLFGPEQVRSATGKLKTVSPLKAPFNNARDSVFLDAGNLAKQIAKLRSDRNVFRTGKMKSVSKIKGDGNRIRLGVLRPLKFKAQQVQLFYTPISGKLKSITKIKGTFNNSLDSIILEPYNISKQSIKLKAPFNNARDSVFLDAGNLDKQIAKLRGDRNVIRSGLLNPVKFRANTNQIFYAPTASKLKSVTPLKGTIFRTAIPKLKNVTPLKAPFNNARDSVFLDAGNLAKQIAKLRSDRNIFRTGKLKTVTRFKADPQNLPIGKLTKFKFSFINSEVFYTPYFGKTRAMSKLKGTFNNSLDSIILEPYNLSKQITKLKAPFNNITDAIILDAGNLAKQIAKLRGDRNVIRSGLINPIKFRANTNQIFYAPTAGKLKTVSPLKAPFNNARDSVFLDAGNLAKQIAKLRGDRNIFRTDKLKTVSPLKAPFNNARDSVFLDAGNLAKQIAKLRGDRNVFRTDKLKTVTRLKGDRTTIRSGIINPKFKAGTNQIFYAPTIGKLKIVTRLKGDRTTIRSGIINPKFKAGTNQIFYAPTIGKLKTVSPLKAPFNNSLDSIILEPYNLSKQSIKLKAPFNNARDSVFLDVGNLKKQIQALKDASNSFVLSRTNKLKIISRVKADPQNLPIGKLTKFKFSFINSEVFYTPYFGKTKTIGKLQAPFTSNSDRISFSPNKILAITKLKAPFNNARDAIILDAGNLAKQITKLKAPFNNTTDAIILDTGNLAKQITKLKAPFNNTTDAIILDTGNLTNPLKFKASTAQIFYTPTSANISKRLSTLKDPLGTIRVGKLRNVTPLKGESSRFTVPKVKIVTPLRSDNSRLRTGLVTRVKFKSNTSQLFYSPSIGKLKVATQVKDTRNSFALSRISKLKAITKLNADRTSLISGKINKVKIPVANTQVLSLDTKVSKLKAVTRVRGDGLRFTVSKTKSVIRVKSPSILRQDTLKINAINSQTNYNITITDPTSALAKYLFFVMAPGRRGNWSQQNSTLFAPDGAKLPVIRSSSFDNQGLITDPYFTVTDITDYRIPITGTTSQTSNNAVLWYIEDRDILTILPAGTPTISYFFGPLPQQIFFAGSKIRLYNSEFGFEYFTTVVSATINSVTLLETPDVIPGIGSTTIQNVGGNYDVSVYFTASPTSTSKVPYPIGSYVRLTNNDTGEYQTVQITNAGINFITFSKPSGNFALGPNKNGSLANASPTLYPSDLVSTSVQPKNPREMFYYSRISPGFKGQLLTPFGASFAQSDGQLYFTLARLEAKKATQLRDALSERIPRTRGLLNKRLVKVKDPKGLNPYFKGAIDRTKISRFNIGVVFVADSRGKINKLKTGDFKRGSRGIIDVAAPKKEPIQFWN